LRTPRRTLVIASVVVLFAFVAGLVVGAAGSRLWHLRGGRRVIHVKQMQFMSDRVLHRLDRELDLTAEQRAQIEKILRARTERMDRVWGDIGPRVRKEMDATNAEIERVLTPEQREKFSKLKMRFFRHRVERGTMPPPPPPF
jgi:Spy/CpxP family protein refolding chaperone